ncbi:hypothetical protein JHK86_001103 [Glycine max]|nr:hypothetical protein JHK86_001103 [Glycine max]
MEQGPMAQSIVDPSSVQKDFTALESGETRSRREEKKNSSKAPTVQMVESDDSDNSFGDSTDDEVALMSRGFK